MLELIRYDFHDNLVRIIMIDGAPWWLATDVCNALGIASARQAVARLDDDERILLERRKDLYAVHTPPVCSDEGQTENSAGNTVFAVSESGLYSLILTSRRPEAKAFKKWVTAEVLPSIRKTGGYNAPQPLSRAPSPPEQDARADWTIETKLSAVREIRRMFGLQEGRAAWEWFNLPRALVRPADDRLEEAAYDALEKILLAPLGGLTVGRLIAEAAKGSDAMRETLRRAGVFVLPRSDGIAFENTSEFLRSICATMTFPHSHVLKYIQGATTGNRYYFREKQARAVLLPFETVMEAVDRQQAPA